MLIELLRSSAARDPHRPFVVTATDLVSTKELLARSEAVAANLVRESVPRLACLIGDVADLIAVVSGATAAGVEVCICPTYLDQAGIDELIARLGCPPVATDGTQWPLGARILPVATLTSRTEAVPSDADPVEQRDDPGLVILTTGTTGAPKPTRHSWTRLLAGVAGTGPGAVWLLTYNVNQFAGIQVLLHALVNDATIVVPKSRRPIDAIAAIRTHGVTHASGTPTFWRMLLVNIDDGGPTLRLRQVTLGGEVVPEELLDRLRTFFPEARITHIFAGTEFGSAIAVSDGRPGLPVSLMERSEGGRAQIRVVDGELQVRSAVGMIGYLDDRDVASDWIPTGDLVERVGDRLLFIGRINDRINVGGTKVSPHSVEEVVHRVPGVAMAAAYGKSNPITGAIVAVDIVAVDAVDRDELKSAIRVACQALPPAARPRLIRFVDELAERGGKVTRPTETVVPQ